MCVSMSAGAFFASSATFTMQSTRWTVPASTRLSLSSRFMIHRCMSPIASSGTYMSSSWIGTRSLVSKPATAMCSYRPSTALR